MEIWKDIEGYEGLYQVSNLGRVKSLKSNKEKILKSNSNGHNYLRLLLCKNNKKKSLLVHRLVAKAFIPNIDNLPEVNHKDEDKTNNCADNLEWCTAKYNSNFGTRKKRLSELKNKAVIQIKEEKVINIFKSAKEAKKKTGINKISACCRNEFKQAGGYVWKYVESEVV